MTIALIARLALAGVFAAAGLTKLADRNGTRKAVVDFGTPETIAGALAILLPIAELGVAVLLLPASTALVGALGALALLMLFSAAIAISLARGKTPECHCFGQLHSAPASWKTLARNAVLAGVAVVAIAGTFADPAPSATAWVGDLDGSGLVALAVGVTAIVLLSVGAVAFLSLMRSYGHVLVRLERVEAALEGAGLTVDEELQLPEIGLAPGTPTPFFAATAIAGGQVSPETIASSGLPTLLLFSSPHCGPCAALMPSVAEWQDEHADRLLVVVASSGSAEEVREEAERHGLEHVLHDVDNRLSELFQANGTPSAVLLAPEGTVASWVASGAEWIEQLVSQTLSAEDDAGLPLGAAAPDLELSDLDGERVSLGELRGRDSLLLFWNPDCGYCRGMHADLLSWERSANGVTPRLVVVSSGDAESTRAEGFGSLVLLDAEFTAGEAFHASGTPMAVLIDSEGRIASGVAAGADAVFELAQAPART